jgi:hypothetical protein
MITDVLEACGLFCGWRKDPNQEAWLFLKINDWLLRQAGGSWEWPAPLHTLLADAPLRALVGDYCATLLRTPRTLSFLGPWRYLRRRTPFNLREPWGWKDPRNTFTLPLWLDLFPDAKVVHIVRHGVDVAQSLMVRQRAAVPTGRRLLARRRALYWLGARQPSFALHVRCTTLAGSFDTWEEYTREAETQVRRLGARALTVRYEEVLRAPREHLSAVLAFCGVTPRTDVLNRAYAALDPARAFAYRGDPALCRFADEHAVRLRGFGY